MDTGKTILHVRKPIWYLMAIVRQHLMMQNERLQSPYSVLIENQENSSFIFPSPKGPPSEEWLLPRTSLPPAAALPLKGGVKVTATGTQVPSKGAPASPLRLPKDCHRSLGDLKVEWPMK